MYPIKYECWVNDGSAWDRRRRRRAGINPNWDSVSCLLGRPILVNIIYIHGLQENSQQSIPADLYLERPWIVDIGISFLITSKMTSNSTASIFKLTGTF